MSNIIYSIFRNKKVNLSKLWQFGFEQTESDYIYSKVLSESGFILTVHITKQGEISSEIIDPSLNEPYTLHLTDGVTGGFVEMEMQKKDVIIVGGGPAGLAAAVELYKKGIHDMLIIER